MEIDNSAEVLNKSNIPKHNKFRLVYRYDEKGNAKSFFHINHKMAVRIIKIIKYLQKKTAKVTIDEMYNDMKKQKQLKISKRTLYNTIHTMIGIVSIDIREDIGYRKIMSAPIDVTQSLYHKKRNLPQFPQYFDAPFYIFLSRG